MNIKKLTIEALLVGIDGENPNVEVYVDGEEVAVMSTSIVSLIDPTAAAKVSTLTSISKQRPLPWTPLSAVPIEDEADPVAPFPYIQELRSAPGSFKAEPDLPNFHNPMNTRPRRLRGRGDKSPFEYYFKTEDYRRLSEFLKIGTRPKGDRGVWLTQEERVTLNEYKVTHPPGTPSGRPERPRPGRGNEPETVTEYRFGRAYKQHSVELAVGTHERRGVPFVWLTQVELEVVREYLGSIRAAKGGS